MNQALEIIKQQAVLLAQEDWKAEPRIESIYWVPSATEIRLIEVEPDIKKER